MTTTTRCPSTLQRLVGVTEWAEQCDGEVDHDLPHRHMVSTREGAVVATVTWLDGPHCRDRNDD